jgi:predicted neuraminidase
MAIKKTKLFVATIRVAVRAEACDYTVDGACDWFSGLLSENSNVFDWAHGSENGVHPKPKLVEVDETLYEEGDLFTAKKGR